MRHDGCLASKIAEKANSSHTRTWGNTPKAVTSPQCFLFGAASGLASSLCPYTRPETRRPLRHATSLATRGPLSSPKRPAELGWFIINCEFYSFYYLINLGFNAAFHLHSTIYSCIATALNYSTIALALEARRVRALTRIASPWLAPIDRLGTCQAMKLHGSLA